MDVGTILESLDTLVDPSGTMAPHQRAKEFKDITCRVVGASKEARELRFLPTAQQLRKEQKLVGNQLNSVSASSMKLHPDLRPAARS